MRLKPSDLELWKTAAEKAGMTLTSWLEQAANSNLPKPTVQVGQVEARLAQDREGLAVTEDGVVFRLEDDDWALESPYEADDGYLYVKGGPYPTAVHRLVIETFQGPPPFDGLVCRHLDGNRQNNNLDNLRWGTPRQNALDTAEHKRLRQKGEIPPLKPTRQNLVCIKVTKEDLEFYDKAAKRANLTRSGWMRVVLNVASGRSNLTEQMLRAVAAAAPPKPVKDGKW